MKLPETISGALISTETSGSSVRAAAPAARGPHPADPRCSPRSCRLLARASVRRRFLTTRLMEDWLDLIGSFEVGFRLKNTGAPPLPFAAEFVAGKITVTGTAGEFGRAW